MRNHTSPNRGGQQKWTRNNEGFRIRSPCSKDEDLALFHNMRTLENKNFLHPSTDDIDASLSNKLGGLTGFRASASSSPSWKGNDLLATADSEKTDYDWLLTPPGTPLFPSLDKDSLQTYMDHTVVTRSYSASKGSRLSASNTTELHRISHRSPGPRTPTSTPSSTSSSHTFSRRAPSPSRANSSPTLRPSTPVKTLTRSATIMNKSSTRSSPPVLRRTNTSPSVRSSSTERSAPPSKGRSSISPKMQAWQAPELGFSAEPPPNLRTSLSDRPLSGSRNGTGRQRIGVQEARHSYSEAIEGRQSHWRNSSSSASKLSSSTTSQDRWSSRGSVISSSDDGMDVMDPTFLDFSTTSPNSTSGTSRSLAGRYVNEVISGYSPTASRQKKETASSAEKAGLSSISARKSLESSMQRVDHRRVAQNMFRPLLSSAPTTSFCNIGHTAAKHRPANAFVESSITASSNASSEKGVRIFPGNESSDGEGEVESEWDRSMPAVSAMKKFVLNENDRIDYIYNRLRDQVDSFEQESVADNVSCTMDDTDSRGVHAKSLHWERVRSGEQESQEEDQNCLMSKSPSTKRIVCAADEDAVYCSSQQSNADNHLFENNQEDIQKGSSAWLHCDSVTPYLSNHGQDETEVCDGTLNCNKSYKKEEENCQEAHIGTNQPVMESITNVSRNKNTPYHGNYDPGLHSHSLSELRIPSHIAASKKNTGSPEKEHEATAVLKDNSFQDMEESPVMKVLFSKNTNANENIPSSLASIVAGIPLEDFFQPKSPISVGQQSSNWQELQGESSSFPSTPTSEMQSTLVYLPEAALEASFHESDINMLEIQKSFEPKGPKCNNLTKPENQLPMENERGAHSENFSGGDQTTYTQVGSVCHAINLDNEDLDQLTGILSHDDFDQASLKEEEEEEKSHNSDVPSSGSLESMEIQKNEHCPVDPDTAFMVLGGESSSEESLGIADSEEEELDSASAHSQNDVQSLDELQPDTHSEQTIAESDLQGRALTASIVGAEVEKNTATQVNSAETTEGQDHPQRGSPLKTHASTGPRAATSSFSLEEATNTILFCSSIVHEMVYKASSIAAQKEAEALNTTVPLVPQIRGQNTNADFISSLREKVSKSATWKVKHKEARVSSRKLPKVELPEMHLTITKHPTPIKGMDRDSVRLEADKDLPDNTKERTFMGVSVNSNCKCTVM